MDKEFRHRVIAFCAVAAIAFAVGFFISDDSLEMAKLRAELAKRPPTLRTGKGTGASSVWKGPANIPTSSKASATPAESTSPSSPNGLFAKMKITKEDLDKALEMNKRRARGEYILNNERPTTRKLVDYDFTQIVSRTAEQRAAEYDQLFGQIGVSPEAAEQLKTHVAKIHRASLEAEVAIDQLLNARRDYDQRLRSTMSDETYERYRQFEEAKPAVREYQELQTFARTKNMAIDPTYEQAVVALFQQTQAYTMRSWHEPFDGLPQPIVGIENVIPAEEQLIQQITEAANQVLSRTDEAGLPEDHKNLLATYYAARVQEKQRGLDELKARFASGSTGSPNPVRPNGPGR